MTRHWDIFCKVVDNFGDIGVAWRLARMLASEHGIEVRLWVDDLAALSRIWPATSTGMKQQRVAGVDVRLWSKPFPATVPGDVVIETFQCALPDSFVIAMAAKPVAPCWINLDYLSAEDWVAGCHRLPSPHPRLPLTKHFYFPGFDPNTGGLLHERGLEDQRLAFVDDASAQAAFWAQHGLGLPQDDELRVSLFCYGDAPVPELFEIWAAGKTPLTALVPEGAAAERMRARLASGTSAAGWIERGAARFKVIPFTDQVGFDRLLWACDVNFVRGEDSFVRAHWARRPFVWNIYPQGENTHWIKMHAFLDRYTADLDDAHADAVRHLWRVWNGIVRPAELQQAWEDFIAGRGAIARHAERWAARLAEQDDLATGLVNFCAGVGKCRVTQEPGISP